MIQASGGAPFIVGRSSLVGALLLCCVPVASAQQQDSPALARALERAEQYYVAIGPRPLPIAKWLGADRLAWSADAKAPWTVLEATTGRVLESEVADAAVGGPGATSGLPLGTVKTRLRTAMSTLRTLRRWQSSAPRSRAIRTPGRSVLGRPCGS